MVIWLVVRAGLVMAAFLLGLFGYVEPVPKVSLLELLAIFLLGPVAVLITLVNFGFNDRSTVVWRSPAWSQFPLSFKEPLQSFHFGGFWFLASGVGFFLRQLFRGIALSPSSFFFLVLGAGMLCGVRLCVALFRSRMEETKAPGNTIKSNTILLGWKIKKLVISVFLIWVAIWLFFYARGFYYIDAYPVSMEAVATSAVLQNRIGSIKRVILNPFDSSFSISGSKGKAALSFYVVGENGRGTVIVASAAKFSTWRVEHLVYKGTDLMANPEK